jgi:hypothetical protein
MLYLVDVVTKQKSGLNVVVTGVPYFIKSLLQNMKTFEHEDSSRLTLETIEILSGVRYLRIMAERRTKLEKRRFIWSRKPWKRLYWEILSPQDLI